MVAFRLYKQALALQKPNQALGKGSKPSDDANLKPPSQEALRERFRGPPGPSSSPFLRGASGRQRQKGRIYDELRSPCCRISAACCTRVRDWVWPREA